MSQENGLSHLVPSYFAETVQDSPFLYCCLFSRGGDGTGSDGVDALFSSRLCAFSFHFYFETHSHKVVLAALELTSRRLILTAIHGRLTDFISLYANHQFYHQQCGGKI